ncbi:MAG: DUF58 domain-containing protein [Methylococcaceae bacterium]|nr:MAG: DUF58 domain-containing protein [Methylococcaceae bacterium]
MTGFWSKFIPKRQPRLDKHPFVLGLHNVYVLPGRWGISFVVLVFLLSIISTNYNNNLGFLLTFLLTVLGLASAIHGQRNLAGLSLTPGKVDAVFLGEPLAYPLQLENASFSARYAITAITSNGDKYAVAQAVPHSITPILLYAIPSRRGRHSIGTLVVESRYPFGLFRLWTRFTFAWHGLVYPAPAPDSKPLPISSDEQGAGAGNVAGDDDLTGFRRYQTGDPIKHLHWKSYAKGRGLHTRIYLQGSPKFLWVDFNMADEADVEAKISRLCRWVLDAEHMGIDYGLRLPGLEIAPHRGASHLEACLTALALLTITR